MTQIKHLVLALSLGALLETVDAIYQYKQCLKCFHESTIENPFYCNEGDGSCQKKGSPFCNNADVIGAYYDCVNGFENCNNQTFSVDDFSKQYTYEKNLVPGYGCFMEVDRTLNGTWGQLRIEVPEKDSQEGILIFEETNA